MASSSDADCVLSSEDLLGNVVQLLNVLADARPSADPDGDFLEAMSSHQRPSGSQDIEASLQSLSRVSPQQFASSLGALSGNHREMFHAQAILLASETGKQMPHLSQAVTALRLLMVRILPSLAGQPEDAEIGTTAEISRNYRAVEFLANLAKPEDPALRAQTAEVVRQAAESTRALHAAEAYAESLRGKLKHAEGLAARPEPKSQPMPQPPTSPAPACPTPSSSAKTGVIVLAVLVAVLLVALVVLVVRMNVRPQDSVKPVLAASRTTIRPVHPAPKPGGRSGWGFEGMAPDTVSTAGPF